ncbi:MAG: flagellar biosynthesis protein FlgA [Rhodoplanes sp.]|uniref:NAD(P)H-dependent oxidoreductase n=1 Tax=Rhodoplanes sp. TaxID=1968906 RepID=UPI0017D4D9B1|nr:SAF domain-containing protein [Rhodoplanes sp.]NVO15313.1 flagellar biosynthesis protein FlgA [Rhodoplanes sp.]
MIYHHLFKKLGRKKTVHVGIIGTGAYGTAIATQAPHTPYLAARVVADISRENARRAYERAGIGSDQIVYCDSAAEAQLEIEKGHYVYTDNCELVSHIPIVDVVCECTGIPEASATYALDALNQGKHVAMVTKDCDSAVGPILKRIADEKGLVYTPVDGDQHGLLVQMVEWARSVGLTVLSGGKATDGEFIYDCGAGTVTIKTDKTIQSPYVSTITVDPKDRKYLQMIPPGGAAEYVAKRLEILRSLPQSGSYDLCEMTVAANYTVLAPAVDTLVHAPLRITEIPIAYCAAKDGGVFASEGVIDIATCLRAPEESGLGGGVFLVVRCDNAYSHHVLTTKGQIANHDGTTAVIYRPYHLCGVETAISILVAGLLGMNTASDTFLPRYDLVKVAARDIAAGEVFGNDHSMQLTARIVPAAPITRGGHACAHLLTGNRAKTDIPCGTTITYDMVVEPPESVIWRLRRLQDETFFG